MPITLNCPKCHKPFRVRDESVGGRVRCPTCGAVLQVPGSLAPVSHMGFDPPEDQDPAEMSGTQRPVADDVAGVGGSMDDLMLGGAGRRTTGGGFNPHETALPAPPSIKLRGPSPVAPVPAKKPEIVPPAQVFQSNPAAPLPTLPTPSSAKPAPTPMPPLQAPRPVSLANQELKPIQTLGDDTSAWQKVRGGLRLIRYGLFLWLVPILAGVGHAAWWMFQPDAALKADPGLLKLEGVVQWQEWVAAYTALPLALAILLLFFGRLKCSRVPAETHARGFMQMATIFTLIAATAGLVALVSQLPMLAQKAKLPSQAGPVAFAIYFPTAIMADLCTLLFIGQIGWPVGRPQLQKSVAGLFAFVLFGPAVLLIVDQFYPMIGAVRASFATGSNPLAGNDNDLTRRTLLLSGSTIGMVILLFLRYAGVAGAARRAIRQHLGE